MRANKSKPRLLNRRITLTSLRFFLVLFGAVCVDHCLATDSPWKKSWTPSEHQTNMAFFLAEHHSQYILADHLDQASSFDFRNNMKEYIYYGLERDMTNSPWQVFGHAYTNFVRQCRPFMIKSNDNLIIPIIAIQHILATNEDIQCEQKGFTLYYNLCTGKISRSLDLFPVAIFSPAPPYHLSMPIKSRETDTQMWTTDQDISVEFDETENIEQGL